MVGKVKRKDAGSKAQREQKPQAVPSALEAEYAKYFAPQGQTPGSFQIFTLTDWRQSISTANHT